MPLVAHSALPSFDRLREEGYEILSPERAQSQDIRELHIGLLNLMPDAALRATERQFFRLLGSCNRIVQICIHPFTVANESRSRESRTYLETHYEDFTHLREAGLDALLITGANPASHDMTLEPFWRPLMEVVDWARDHVCSVLCSCFASHAVLQQHFGVERRRLPQKRWGVYSHRVVAPGNAMVRAINTRFEAPRSHRFEVTSAQVEGAGCRVLATSEQAGLHLATSDDGFRFVFFQGHPEYDVNSLLKEYKRELSRYSQGEREHLPPYPENYLPALAQTRLSTHADRVQNARERAESPPPFPETEILPYLDNTWTDTGKALFNNWLGVVYQLSDQDRRRPFQLATSTTRILPVGNS